MNAKTELLLARILAHLPIVITSAIGAYLGRRQARKGIAAKRKWVSRLHHSFELLDNIDDAAERESKIVEYIENKGRLYAEYTVVHRMQASGRFTLEGAHKIVDKRRAKIFVSAHTAHWELVAEALQHLGTPVADIYDPIENDVRLQLALAARLKMCPEADGYKYIPASKTAAKEVINWLKAGGSLLIFGDEEVGSKIHSPAFGRDIFLNGNLAKVVKLACKYDLQIVPLHIQKEGSARYRAVIDTPLAPLPKLASIEQQKEQITYLDRKIEAWVREDLCAWYWLDALNLTKD